VLDPADLLHPRSAVSGSTDIEIRDSKHLFLRQSLFSDRLREGIEARKGRWPLLVTSIALKWLDEGLQDRGITRDLDWGVPVNAADWGPNPEGRTPDVEGLAGKVFYVWFDAPIEYISATAEWADARAGGKAADADWERWWRQPVADDVTYVQFMGKDNVPFHTVGFPCTLMGVNEGANAPWKLVDELKGFNWLDYYGGRFSTSQNRGVFMDQALELLPPDYWRWWIVANAPETSDATFVWEQFQAQVNADLADVLGNFVNRIVKFAESKFDGVVPDAGEPGPLEAKLEADLRAGIAEATAQFEAMEFRKAAVALRAVWVLGNEYLQEAAPWTAFKTDVDRAAVGVRTGLNLVALFARLAAPVMPHSAVKIGAAVGATDLSWPTADEPLLDALPRGQTVAAAGVLFTKIEDTQVAEWSERFGGADA
jgi:methionyl-tRNA synthetase